MNELEALNQIGTPRILVLGDLILDRYTWGDAERVSPEAPVLVLRADTHEVRLGGAASVAGLLRALDAEVILAGVVGDDVHGHTLRKLLADEQIEHNAVLIDSDRPTTTKERFIGRAAGRHTHQILRVDDEVREPLLPYLEIQLTDAVLASLHEVQAILISDYAKGVCTPRLLETVIAAATTCGIAVIVDPARIADFTRYRGATLLKPNRLEAERATAQSIASPDDALIAATAICDRFGVQSVVVTLDRDGMVLAQKGKPGELHPTTPRSVYDITGAGDMALAMLGLCQAEELPLADAVRLANLAAGIEVERFGVASVTRADIRTASVAHPQFHEKIVTLDQLVALADTYRRDGRRIVCTNGCFDLLHVGHLHSLHEASTMGDVLIVAVNSDASVRRLKGPNRPIIHEQERAALLAALGFVHYVVVFSEQTPHHILQRVRPDVLVKGGSTKRLPKN